MLLFMRCTCALLPALHSINIMYFLNVTDAGGEFQFGRWISQLEGEVLIAFFSAIFIFCVYVVLFLFYNAADTGGERL